MKLDTDIQFLKGVGEKRAKLLNKLGVFSVGDLLRFYPRTYEDMSKIKKISQAQIGEVCCIKAIVDRTPKESRIRKGLTIYKTDVTDGESIMQITIFNSKYAAEKLKEGEEFLFFGKITGTLWKKEMNSPEFIKAEGGDRIRPIYPQTEGLSSRTIERLMKTALLNTEGELKEILPQKTRDRYYLCNINDAVNNIHFPKDGDYLSYARRRLVFEEFYILQLSLMLIKCSGRGKTSAVIKDDFSEEFISDLPFTMTGAQERSVGEIVNDMKNDVPMNRLLQGDVGSGKTAVAAAVIYTAVKNGFQSALMAPTEILAKQHYKTFETLFKGTGINFALMTGSTKQSEKNEIKEKLKTGEIGFIIGTHALIQDDVVFSNLGLVITDEQHRFGVKQRAALNSKGDNPHVLVMSATPIPRTLALMIYGDLDISVLDELPPGRKEVVTYYVTGDKRPRVYSYIKKYLDAGFQGYAVCPLIEEGESEIAAAEDYAEGLRKGAFMGYSVGLLHGRMTPAEKEKVMDDFVGGKIQLLVSTTVIEVGVDVPNAVIMLVENAERFGLSQLHQLRGRIGRGSESSVCILISDAGNGEAKRRLEIMTKTSDGFKIADEDLKMRGPGDFFGSRQHGLPELRIADMMTDTQLLFESNKAAAETHKDDPRLKKPENAELRRAVARLFQKLRG